MTYNMTPFMDANNILEQMIAVNNVSGNWLSYSILLITFMVMLLSLLKNNPPAESFTAAAGLCVVLSLLFLVAGMINIIWLIGFVLLFVGGGISLYKE